MITIRSLRNNGELSEAAEQKRTILSALVRLAKFELGFGGRVIGLSESELCVQTGVFNCIDVTVFSGTPEEMNPLIQLAYFYQEVNGLGASRNKAVVDQIRRVSGGAFIDLSMLAPLLTGGHQLKTAIMLACGIRERQEMQAGLDSVLDIENFVAAADLVREGHCSLTEALAL